MLNAIYKHMCMNYHAYSMVANILIALSIAGLSLLGILTTVLTSKVLVAWGFIFAVLFCVGKLLDQEVNDMDKVGNHQKRRCDSEPTNDSANDSVDTEHRT